MKRQEFLNKLEKGLDRLPPEELKDVLEYYNEIFLDAGEENEERTAENLGNVEDIIRQIYDIAPDGRPEFVIESVRIPKGAQNGSRSNRSDGSHKRKDFRISDRFAKVLLAALLFPFWFPIAVVIFSLLAALVIAAAAIVFTLGLVGVILSVTGVATIFTVPPAGFIMAGIGMVIIGIFTLITVPIFKSLVRGSINLLDKAAGKLHSLLIGAVNLLDRAVCRLHALLFARR